MVSHGYVLPTRGIAMQSDSSMSLSSSTAALLTLASHAESLDFSSLWVGDSILTRYRLEPLTTLASIAALTKKVQIGTAIYLLHLRHPIHVAHATATLDQLSGGRFIFGVGVGTSHGSTLNESMNLGVPFSERGNILNDSLDLIRNLWRGETVSSTGIYSFDDARLNVPPSRAPPNYVATTKFDSKSGFPNSIQKRIEQHADGLMPQTDPSNYYSMISHARDIVEKSGRKSSIVATNYTDVVIAPSEKEAFAQARAYIGSYYPWNISDANLKKAGAFGPPEMVAEKIHSFIDAGVEHFIVRFPTLDQKNQLDLYSDLFNL